MKKRFRMVITAGMCVMMAFGAMACGNNSPQQIGGSSDAESNDAAETSGTGYVFSYKGTEIPVDADMAPIAEALGEPSNYYEEPSCAAQGISKIYNYADFDVYTYPDGDVDRVQSVVLKNDNVATAEGVDLSADKAEIMSVYGDDYTESSGQMVYGKDGMKLCFIMDGDSILSIEYNSSILD
jgi:hypothetical protein